MSRHLCSYVPPHVIYMFWYFDRHMYYRLRVLIMKDHSVPCHSFFCGPFTFTNTLNDYAILFIILWTCVVPSYALKFWRTCAMSFISFLRIMPCYHTICLVSYHITYMLSLYSFPVTHMFSSDLCHSIYMLFIYVCLWVLSVMTCPLLLLQNEKRHKNHFLPPRNSNVLTIHKRLYI